MKKVKLKVEMHRQKYIKEGLILMSLFCVMNIFQGISQAKEQEAKKPSIESITAVSKNMIQVKFDAGAPQFKKDDIQFEGELSIEGIKFEADKIILTTSEIDYKRNYIIEIKGHAKFSVDLSPLWQDLYSGKPLGFSVESGRTVFRLFAPRAHSVKLVIFDNHDDEAGAEYAMVAAEDGVWEAALSGELWGKYYGYKIDGSRDKFEQYNPEIVIADPYSVAVVSKNTYLHEAKSIILKTDEYDWEGDTFVNIPQEDLIIYEMHVRDLTVHPSSGLQSGKGTYRGLVDKNGAGGINHILDLGVNAVELLPCQDFGNIEIPYGKEVGGVTNTWNPYARNHWGYMTSYFFAPESYYASGGTMQPGEYNGVHGQQVREFKDMVKAFHKEGIAVLMDVVYNHVSQYDFNPFKYVDKQFYFQLDENLNYLSASGCGNDFKTETKMARRMIIDSIKYWMQEYHVDGFRFDLATMLDWQTIEMIIAEARKINPNVILIAEPWGGGGYDLGGFSKRDMGAWNDLFRNAVKGQNPVDGHGFIFGKYYGGNDKQSMQAYVKGSLAADGLPFQNKAHSINYLESHDDHTLGDFIRIGLGEVKPEQKITDLMKHAKLTKAQLQLNKLAAVFLFTSQGAVMLHEGQEFARSKVIAESKYPDLHAGAIDHNSYDKDNETNWLNFEHKALNRELVDFYKGLIAMRKTYPAFRRTDAEKITFLECSVKPSIGFMLPKDDSDDTAGFVVLINPSPEKKAAFELPEGNWSKIVGGRRAGVMPFGRSLEGRIAVPARTAFVLMKEARL